MTARADAAAATGERILDAALAVFWEKPTDHVVLADIADRAGVTVQTVLRRFGNREGLIVAAAERSASTIGAQRNAARVGDIEDIVRVLLDHYEELGPGVLRMLAAEESSPGLRDIIENGRTFHRDWCERCFAPFLADLTPAARTRRVAQLAAICDVYVWKVLRHDNGLTRRQTHTALVDLLDRLTSPAAPPAPEEP
ncbi:hypothetical protein N802_06940 [Knoellia sinensis KCTC 19936]|uniref:HTH tetR-type domain-containing protein n=2 Tax=Knoellia TaxID=136099 RepID=A0A0A0J359_9MICO|nr:hypothetical protein N802_06940 [Knoellia sinensis KCTC 19936]